MMPFFPGRTCPYGIVAMLLIGCALLDVGGLNVAAVSDRKDEAVAASLAAMLRNSECNRRRY